MACGIAWTDDEDDRLIALKLEGKEFQEIALALNRSHESVKSRWKVIKSKSKNEFSEKISYAALHPPIALDYQSKCLEQEKEIARLKQQLTWAQHAESENRTGGVLTIRLSDVHNADENHMLSCYASVVEKIKEVIRQYEPDQIKLIGFDDWIAGRGIYKNQDLHMAVSDAEAQINVGAMKGYELLCELRAVSQSPIGIVWLRGNHEYANGTSLAAALFHEMRTLCHNVTNVNFVMHWDMAIVNLSAVGYYNLLAMHGFGYSGVSPNSPKFIDAVKDKIIVIQRKLPPEQQVRRVASGHTHWLSVGLERIADLPFDTTGGFQRNTRVQLGMNQRPVGAIVYVSPQGMENEILKPIEIKPESETREREIGDPTLAAQNRKDCGETLERHSVLTKSLGIVADYSELGLVNQGRW